MNRFAPLILVLIAVTCNPRRDESRVATGGNETDSILEIEKTSGTGEKTFIDYPIPNLDSILQHCETSGMIENAPSERFYNPTDSGIFVFYTLFDNERRAHPVKNSKAEFDERFVGNLTTHTYRKSRYGWAVDDKDQMFILLQLTNGTIKIGRSIRVGCTIEQVKSELGQPIYCDGDSSFVFLARNKTIAKFNTSKEVVTSITYGRFNLSDDLFLRDSITRRQIVVGTLRGLK